MDYFYIFIGAFAIFVALFKRELLVSNASFKAILGITIVLFVGGLVLLCRARGTHSMAGALMYPLLSLGAYRVARLLFVRRFGREPLDTFLSWDSGRDADRVFNIAYFVSMLIGLILFTGIVSNLTDAA